MMVEVPAAALTIELFDAQFLSIGSNDLIQYATACSRDSQRVAALADPLQPGVLRLMRYAVEQANARQMPISICGDMASEPHCVPALLRMGLRCLSVAPVALAAIKNAIAKYRGDD
jgi:phosphotransferase system enzyme I (PtsI)